MLSWKVKAVVAFLAVTVSLETFPQDADAFIFRWLRRRRAERVALYRGATACYTPTVAARVATIPQPGCGSCNTCPTPCAAPCPAPCMTTQRVCSYAPQTCYRTVYKQVPVTVYRPVTTVDPCSGCPTTCMKPCTTMTQVAQRVPVTTYRQVCRMVQTPVAAPVAVQQVAPQVQYAPAPSYAPANPGCSSCGVPQAAPTYAPATSLSPIPAPAGPTSNLAPTTIPGPANGANQNVPANNNPTLPSNQYNYPGTNQSNLSNGSGNRNATGSSYRPRLPESDIRPLPDLERDNAAPALLNPDDRTASRSLVTPGTIMPISWQTEISQPAAKHVPVESSRPKTRRLSADGWRAAT